MLPSSPEQQVRSTFDTQTWHYAVRVIEVLALQPKFNAKMRNFGYATPSEASTETGLGNFAAFPRAVGLFLVDTLPLLSEILMSLDFISK